MTEEEQELLEKYESRIRKGFPVGEVKTELMEKGFSEERADNFMTELSRLSAQKSEGRNTDFRMIISALFIIFGIFQWVTTKSMIGVWFIISGVVKIAYDLFGKRKDE